MNWLYIPIVLCFIGGVILVFFLDWVWSIDKNSKHMPHDAQGNPIRTDAWNRAHRKAGSVMMVVAIGLSLLVYWLGS